MNTIKIVPPVLAFAFAIVAAFANNFTKKSTLIQYYKRTGGSPPCQTCQTSPDVPNECSDAVTSIMCLCETGEQVHEGSAVSCVPLWKVIE